MRPQILFPLFASVGDLPGVGAKTAALVTKLAGPRIADLLWHLPSDVVDRRHRATAATLEAGALATLVVRVDRHLPPARPGQPYRVRCSDATGSLDLVYFRGERDWLGKLLPEGEPRVISGRADVFRESWQMVQPVEVGPLDALSRIAVVEPVYPQTAGLTSRQIARLAGLALDRAPTLPEWLDEAWRARQSWPDWRTAIARAHAPEGPEDLDAAAPWRRRLVFDELLAHQLALALVRQAWQRRPGRKLIGDNRLRDIVLDGLGFSLTVSQAGALAEIDRDLAGETRMLRLLQGDVGSGKTVVALLAMLTAVEAGAQAVLLAPTEILVRQHAETIRRLAAPAGLEPVVLTGRDKGRTRDAILAGIADGSAQVILGTHAVLSEDVAFADLALAVVDEQHRFGVNQRLQIAEKGRAVDILVMSATPIPRTLQMAAYGDLDVSALREKPPGRTPVDTRVVAAPRLDEVLAAVGRRLDEGGKIFWVCPLVEEGDGADLAAATERYEALSRRFGGRVGLLHGRMRAADKERIAAAFAEDGASPDRIDLLVATTVIEVGVDVPAASVMVVEHAERFGLAQLHQLRGRVGRGRTASTCILVYTPPLGGTARRRLKALRESQDGFALAETDLALRGAGDVLGTRQSGLPDLKLADLADHADLLAAASDDARLILARDPGLATPRGQALRVLLYLFERDAAVRYLKSG